MFRYILFAIFALISLIACGENIVSPPKQDISVDKNFENALGKGDIKRISTAQPIGPLGINQDEEQAIFDSYYLRNANESNKLANIKDPTLFTIGDPEDLKDLVTGKGPDNPIRDEPDLIPNMKKPPWINISDGDSRRLVPEHIRSNSKDDVTIRGRLFYNDLRREGRFGERRDLDGDSGSGITWLVPRLDTDACYKGNSDCDLLDHQNLLAARLVVADFWEVDLDYEQQHQNDCDDYEYLGSSTISKYGDYSLTIPKLIDDCPDGNTGAEIVVRFRLQFCNTDRYCFELVRKNEEGRKLYTKYHRDAKPWNPLVVNLGSTHTLVDEKFGGNLQDPIGKEWAIAANHYASLVDSMHVLHDEAKIPFRFKEYGALEVYMCPQAYRDRLSETDKNRECFKGRAYGSGLIGSTEPKMWPIGPLMAHEYGHIIDSRTGYQSDCAAWGLTDCHYGRQVPDLMEGGVLDDEDNEYYKDKNGDGLYQDTGEKWEEGWLRTSWSATSYEYPYVALLEGWASFVSRAVFKTCDEIEENTGGGSVQPDYPNSAHHGNGYVRNVTKLFCDWYDEHRSEDDDAEEINGGVDRFPGYGDRFDASLWSIWYNLDNSTSSKKGRNICDYVRYYIEDRKGATRVGQSDHDYYKGRIINLLYNNGLKCSYEPPEPSSGIDSGRPYKNGSICHAGPNGRKECS